MDRAREVIDEAVCNQIEAEAKFIRAFNYTYLTELYGDVPLITTNLTLEEAQTPRSPKAKVVELILSDLDYAASVLPEAYSGDDKGRVTKGAAYALKARVALYNDNFPMAISAAEMVMDMDYELHSNYGDLFQLAGENSKETIFNLSYHLDVTRNFGPIIMNSRKAVGWSRITSYNVCYTKLLRFGFWALIAFSLRIFFCSIRTAYCRVSGRGAQPGR